MKRQLLLWACCLALSACGGGGSGGGTVTPAATLTGTVTFPSTVAKAAARDVAAATSSAPLVQILDLNGNLIANATVLQSSTSDAYTYSTTATIGKDAIIKVVRDAQTLRAALDYSAFTSGMTRNVNVTTTTAVVVIEQKIGISAGSLGTSSAPASPPALRTFAPTTLETIVLQAVTAASSSASTDFTSVYAAYANLVNIVTAATISNIDAAQYIAGTASTTISTPITIYSVSASGAPVSSQFTSEQVKSSITSITSALTGGDTPPNNTGTIIVTW